MEHLISCRKPELAVYTEAGKAQIKEQIAYYQEECKTIYEGLKNADTRYPEQ